MNKPDVNIVVLTYHTKNLKICSQCFDALPYNINLIIHNDNPNENFSMELLDKFSANRIDLISETENQGMLKSRLRCIDHLDSSYEYTIFLDDDDLLLPVNIVPFVCPKLIVDLIKITKTNELVEYLTEGKVSDPQVEERYGVSGNIYRTSYLIGWKKVLMDFLPNIKKVFGTDVINAGEDDIFDQLSYRFYHHRYGKSYAQKSNEIGMIWNQIESPIGRYSIEDARYSNNPNLVKSFNEKFEEVLVKFNNYLNGK